jgi:hypothetical protein
MNSHSKAVAKSRAGVIASGGKTLHCLLNPEAARALAELKARGMEPSETAIIVRLLLDARDSRGRNEPVDL